MMDNLDQKLLGIFDGKVIRKDLLHRIKKGTNVPTFVLEFLFLMCQEVCDGGHVNGYFISVGAFTKAYDTIRHFYLAFVWD